MRIRKGYVYQDKAAGCWYARVTATDERGKRKDIKRRATDKTQATKLLRQLNTTLDTRGVEAVEAEKLTFDDLATYYVEHYAKPAEYVDEQKVTGLRSVDEVLRYVKTLREYFGKRKLKSISYDIRAFRLACPYTWSGESWGIRSRRPLTATCQPTQKQRHKRRRFLRRFKDHRRRARIRTLRAWRRRWSTDGRLPKSLNR
jgi:hypothetical protein